MAISLLNYREFGAENAPSMRDSMEIRPYEGMDKIAEYLKNGGQELGICMRPSKDCFTGERMPKAYCTFYGDGEYCWKDSLAYYVEKYNLRLPRQFEEHVRRYYN